MRILLMLGLTLALCFNSSQTYADPIPYNQAVAESYGVQTEPVKEVEQADENRDYTDEDLYYLSRTIWGEARGEGRNGMLHVGSVILNRVDSGRWDDSIKEVVLAPSQFTTWRVTPRIRTVTEREASLRAAIDVARQLLENGSINRYHFFNAGSAGRRGIKIGNHYFRS